jgi:2-dehydropantoate 2-reductase
MTILITGSSGPGAIIGSQLAAARNHVAYLDHRRRAAALDFAPLDVKSDLGDRSAYVRSIEPAEISSPFDLLLVTAEAQELTALIDVLPRGISPSTAIISFVDGIEAIARLRTALPEVCILDGIHDLVTVLDEHGAVKQIDDANHVLIGARSPLEQVTAEKVVKLLNATGLDAEVGTDVERRRWERAIRLVSVCGLTAMMQVPIARIGEVDDDQLTLWQLMQECAAVGVAAGQAIDIGGLTEFMSRLPAVPSTLINAMLNRVEAGDTAAITELVGQMHRAARGTNTPASLLDLVAMTLAARRSATDADDETE